MADWTADWEAGGFKLRGLEMLLSIVACTKTCWSDRKRRDCYLLILSCRGHQNNPKIFSKSLRIWRICHASLTCSHKNTHAELSQPGQLVSTRTPSCTLNAKISSPVRCNLLFFSNSTFGAKRVSGSYQKTSSISTKIPQIHHIISAHSL